MMNTGHVRSCTDRLQNGQGAEAHVQSPAGREGVLLLQESCSLHSQLGCLKVEKAGTVITITLNKKGGWGRYFWFSSHPLLAISLT